MILITCSLVYYTRCDFFTLTKRQNFYASSYKMVMCFITSVILKVLKSETKEIITIRYTIVSINMIYIN
jgi:hypothetical protein